MKGIVSALLSGEATAEDYAALRLPESYRAVGLRKEDVGLFDGVASVDRDPRKSMHLMDVPLPELGPGEALVAVMASSVNYNTVWSARFEPLPTFGFLERYGRLSELAKRHDLPYHVIGSDLAGVVLRTGPGVNAWQPGDEVVAHCLSLLKAPSSAISSSRAITPFASRSTIAATSVSPGSAVCRAWAASTTVFARAAALRTVRFFSQFSSRLAPARRRAAGVW